MKKVLIAAFIPWLFTAFGYKAMAQEENQKRDEKKETEEIIIRKKGDKDANLKIEISGDQVMINGKPLVEFKDDGITVNKRKIIIRDGDQMRFGEGFEGLENLNEFSWSDDGDKEPGAFLGVVTEKNEKGAKITDVTMESAAAKAGLKENDIITKLGDTKIDGPQSLFKAVSAQKPADEVKVTYIRDGKEKFVKATLQERKNNMNKMQAYSFSGPDGSSRTFTMPPMPGMRYDREDLQRNFEENDVDRMNYFPRQKKLGLKIQDTEEGNGVKVLDIEDGSASASAGIKKDDIITEIAGVKVTNTDEVRAQLMLNSTKSTYNIKARRNGADISFDIKIPKKLKTADL